MPIKYGELTIMKEKRFFWKTEPKYIFLFEDGEISDEIVDFYFKFLDSCVQCVPLYFEKTIKSTPHLEVYFEKKNKCFNSLFSGYSNYKLDMPLVSKYNCIYDCCKKNKPEMFGLVRIKSTEQMPRFQFAYENDEFTKQEIQYLIHHILSKAAE